MQRKGGAVRPDEHVLAKLDGYDLRIGENLDTWMVLPEEQQQRISAEFCAKPFNSEACKALLRAEPLWLEGWLLLARHQEQAGDLVAATGTLMDCLRLMPDPRVCKALSQLDPQAVFEGGTGDPAMAKVRVQQARRAAYANGDTALAQLLGQWLVEHAG